MKLFLFAEDVTATQKTLLFSLLSHFQLQPHGLQRTSLPWPSLSPGVCSISCPLSQWRYPTISFSVALFSFCPQSFPASGSFPVSWLFISGGQIYWRFSISPSSDYSGLISFRLVGCDLLAVQETLIVFSNTTVWKHQFFGAQHSLQEDSLPSEPSGKPRNTGAVA